MKRVKNILALALLTVAPVLSFGGVAHAGQIDQSSRLVCKYKVPVITSEIQGQSNDGNQGYTTENCDLKLVKEISVDGGKTFVEDSAATAPTVHVGDTVIWKVVVSNNGSNTPIGNVSVTDVLPSGLTLVGGPVLDPSTSTYSNGVWKFNLKTDPASITFTTTANTVGQIVNTAEITGYKQDRTDGNCCYNGDNEQVSQTKLTYCDSDNTNNKESAYVNVVAVPVVVTPPTTVTTAAVVTHTSTPAAPNTGYGVASSTPVAAFSLFSIGSAGIYGIARSVRRFASN
ncbi:MAG: DUF11 domain-containing protein [Candidatus Saccharimonadales bacterium]